jgi:hypothetical protein
MIVTKQQYNTVINGLRQQLELLRAEGSEYRQAAQTATDRAATEARAAADAVAMALEITRERNDFRADVVAAANITLGFSGAEAKTEEGRLMLDSVMGLAEAYANAKDSINSLSGLVDGKDARFSEGSQAEKIAKCIRDLRKRKKK